MKYLSLILIAIVCGCDTGPQLFVDVAREHDLEYISYTGDHLWYLIDTLGSGVGAGDYDGDGDADLFLLTGSAILDSYQDEAGEYTDALWRNDGNGKFTDVTVEAGVGRSGWSNGAVFVDIESDGDLDIFVTRHGPNLLWRNNGDGTFTDIAEEAGIHDARWAAASAFADLNGDGYLDLYVTNYAKYVIEEQKGTVTWFTHGITQFPQYFEPMDNILYRNNGDGTFTDITREAEVEGTGRSLGVLATDYDDDGDLDLFVANDIGFNDLFQNNGNFQFENVALEAGLACDAEGRFQACMGVASGDYDNDGDVDITVTNYGTEYHTLYRNEGKGYFSDVTPQAGLVSQETLDTVGWGVGLYDFDLDGHLDILSINGHVVSNFVLWYMRNWTDGKGDIPQMNKEAFNLGANQTKHLFLGKGDGTFEDISSKAGSAIRKRRMGRGAAFADLDLDGKMDVVVSNKNQPAQILINQIPSRGNWLKIKLRGKFPNIFAIGARVQVKANAKIFTSELYAGTSYCSANELSLHFGLGEAVIAEQISVRWPDGSTSHFKNLAANKVHFLMQVPDNSIEPIPTAHKEARISGK